MRRGGHAVRGLVVAVALVAAAAGCGDQTAGEQSAHANSAGHWTRIAASSLGPREAATAVWTGHEVLVLGGDRSPCPPSADCVAPTDPPLRHQAAAYDPASDSWRLLAAPPVSLGFVQQPAVAGGIVYLLADAGEGTTRLFGYDPKTDRWADAAPPPGDVGGLVAVGDQVVAYQGSHENGVAPDTVYDPDKDTWIALPASPLGPASGRTMVALDDHRLVLLDLELVPNPYAERPLLYRAAVLDLADRSWQRLPDSEVVGIGNLWLRSGGLLVNPATESYDGGEVGNWGRSYPAGGILDPDTGRWSALPATAPPQPQHQHVGTVAGDGVVVTGNSVLHVRDRSWAALPDLPALHDVGSTATAWAGDRLFVWGGVRFDEAHPAGQLRSAGWTWRPDRVRTIEAGPTDVPTATPSVEPPRTPGGEPWRLIGSWLVTADGEEPGAVLRISGDDVSLWRRCGQLEGSWRADRSGLFVADLYSGSGGCDITETFTPTWLRAAAAFDLRASGPRLLDADGTVVARLAPGGRPTAGPDVLASLADPPTVTAADRRSFPEPAPVPSGLLPADRTSVVGRWLPPADNVQRPEQPMLELRTDGTWTSSDGCNSSGGRWTVGDGGRVLATAGFSTLVGCTNVNVSGDLYDAARAAFDGTALVLLDSTGAETGRLVKAG
jgi:hypothetical protein